MPYAKVRGVHINYKVLRERGEEWDEKVRERAALFGDH